MRNKVRVRKRWRHTRARKYFDMKYFLFTALFLFLLQTICLSQDTLFDAKKWKAPYSLAIPKDW